MKSLAKLTDSQIMLLTLAARRDDGLLDDALPVRQVRERQVEQLCVVLRLLKTLARNRVLALRLDDSDGHSRLELQHVVGAKRAPTAVLLARRDHTTRGDRILLDDLVITPARGLEERQYVIATGVFLQRPGRHGTRR